MSHFLKTAMVVIVVVAAPAGAHAASRYVGSVTKSSYWRHDNCRFCKYRTPSLADKVTLNPQPLPPRSYLLGR
jgi:hypothetical protein